MMAALVDISCRSSLIPQAILLDVDEICDPAHGHQQLSLLHVSYDTQCFPPVDLYHVGTGVGFRAPGQDVDWSRSLHQAHAAPSIPWRQCLDGWPFNIRMVPPTYGLRRHADIRLHWRDRYLQVEPPMTHVGVFPFGQPITTLRQAKRNPRRVFVLGVYASAVHARWIGVDGKTRINALAVASEPEIFWRGDGAADLIRQVEIPDAAGRLEPAGSILNGPSGRALDEFYLKPLGIGRADAWLCDLVPHSCMNEGQSRAIDRDYRPLMSELALPEINWPRAPKSETEWQEMVDRRRRDQIASEVTEASPEILITLGDDPLRRFASFHGAWSNLAAYGQSQDKYGRLHEATIGGCRLQLLPLTHPRQAANLGRSSPKWTELHRNWVASRASRLLGDTLQSDSNQPPARHEGADGSDSGAAF